MRCVNPRLGAKILIFVLKIRAYPNLILESESGILSFDLRSTQAVFFS